jgi:hypothetical protein
MLHSAKRFRSRSGSSKTRRICRLDNADTVFSLDRGRGQQHSFRMRAIVRRQGTTDAGNLYAHQCETSRRHADRKGNRWTENRPSGRNAILRSSNASKLQGIDKRRAIPCIADIRRLRFGLLLGRVHHFGGGGKDSSRTRLGNIDCRLLLGSHDLCLEETPPKKLEPGQPASTGTRSSRSRFHQASCSPRRDDDEVTSRI